MNVLNRSHPVVKGLIRSKPGNVGPSTAKAGQRQELRRIGEEESYGERISAGRTKICVRVELLFLKGGWAKNQKMNRSDAELESRTGHSEVSH